MTLFWVVVGLLVAGALLFVLPPLFGPRYLHHPAAGKLATVTIFNQQLEELDADLANGVLAPEHFEQGRMELEQRLLEEIGSTADEGARGSESRYQRWIVSVIVGLAFPVAVVALYFQVGSPQALVAETALSGAGQGGASPHQVTADQVQLMTTRLAMRLKRNPQDADGWAMLGRSYAMMQRFGDGAAAFAKAAALNPNDAPLIADYADMLAMAQGRRFDGEPTALINQALKIDPNNLKALSLGGTAAFEEKAYSRAVEYWQRLLENIPANTQLSDSVQKSIAEARARGGLAQGTDAASTSAVLNPKFHEFRSSGVVKGTVRLIPELAGRASGKDTLIVFARTPEAPGKLLAVLQLRVKDLPLTFVMDDSMSLLPEMKLSKLKVVVVGARISKLASAANQSGDLVSRQIPVNVGGNTVDLTIRGIVR